MKRFICLVVACLLVCTTAAFAHPFSDVKGHWAEAEIEKGDINKTVNVDPDGISAISIVLRFFLRSK